MSTDSQIEFDQGLKELIELDEVLKQAQKAYDDEESGATPDKLDCRDMKPHFERFSSPSAMAHHHPSVVKVNPMVENPAYNRRQREQEKVHKRVYSKTDLRLLEM